MFTLALVLRLVREHVRRLALEVLPSRQRHYIHTYIYIERKNKNQ